MSADNLVEISGLNFWYDKRRPILSGIDMAIPRGKVVSMMGISGSGKTTLLRLIGGALKLYLPPPGTSLADLSIALLRRRAPQRRAWPVLVLERG